MRVLYVNPAAGLGGSERSLLDVLAALGDAAPALERSLLLFADGELAGRARALGVDVSILPFPASLERIGEFRAEGKTRLALPSGRILFDGLDLVRTFRRHVRGRRPDVIHTNGMKAHVLAAAAVPDRPRVVHFRDFASGRPITRRLLPLLGARSVVVTNSRAVERDLLAIAPRLHTRVVYNGIDVGEFRREGQRAALARLAGLPEPSAGALNIGLVATYAWWKGHRRFIETADAVRAALPERSLRFYVVGGPVYRTHGSEVSEQDLRELVRERNLDDVVGFVPFQTSTAPVYRALDIVVHASERPEPFGRTIVEAMASGCAVVASRAGGAGELFVDGREALGYDPAMPGALAEAVLEMVRDESLRSRLAEAGRQRALADFDRRRMGPELLEVYRRLTGSALG